MSTLQLEKTETLTAPQSDPPTDTKAESQAVLKAQSRQPNSDNYLLPPVTIYENDEMMTVLADLPGVSKDRVRLQCEQETLTLEGELAVQLNPGSDTTAVQAELRHPRFRRSFLIGNELDTHGIKAEMKDGVLTIRIPKKPSARPFKIDIS
jgi:HSP20 family protein